MKSAKLIGNLMILASIIIYSFNTNFMKLLMPQWIEPEGLVFARCLSCAFFFWIICFFLPQKNKIKETPKDISMMMLGGVLGLGINLLLYIMGLNITGPVDVFVIRTIQPILVFILAIFILHEKFTFGKALGIALGLAGALYASITPHEGSAASDSFYGNLLVFISCISNAFFLILIKPYTSRFNAFVVMKWMGTASVIITFPFGWKQLIEAPMFHTSTPGIVWFEFFYVVIFTTLVSYYLSVQALKYISVSVESSYLYLLPVTGTFVTIMLGIQKFSWHDPIALALIICGFLLINRTPKEINIK